jgi:hypothetical protein
VLRPHHQRVDRAREDGQGVQAEADQQEENQDDEWVQLGAELFLKEAAVGSLSPNAHTADSLVSGLGSK